MSVVLRAVADVSFSLYIYEYMLFSTFVDSILENVQNCSLFLHLSRKIRFFFKDWVWLSGIALSDVYVTKHCTDWRSVSFNAYIYFYSTNKTLVANSTNPQVNKEPLHKSDNKWKLMKGSTKRWGMQHLDCLIYFIILEWARFIEVNSKNLWIIFPAANVQQEKVESAHNNNLSCLYMLMRQILCFRKLKSEYMLFRNWNWLINFFSIWFK